MSLRDFSIGQLRAMITEGEPTVGALLEVITALGRRHKLPLAIEATGFLVDLVSKQQAELTAFASGVLSVDDEKRVEAILQQVTQSLQAGTFNLEYMQNILHSLDASPAVQLAAWREVARLAVSRLNVAQGELMGTTQSLAAKSALLNFLPHALASQHLSATREPSTLGERWTVVIGDLTFIWDWSISAGQQVTDATVLIQGGEVQVLPQKLPLNAQGTFTSEALSLVESLPKRATVAGHNVILQQFPSLHAGLYGADCKACKKPQEPGRGRLSGVGTLFGQDKR